MVELFAIFFKTIHGAEIMPLSVMPADDGRFLGYVDAADRVAVGLYAGIAAPGGFRLRLFRGDQRYNYAVADVQQQADDQKS